jgi:uncharacterized protein YecE (DUF72 family)
LGTLLQRQVSFLVEAKGVSVGNVYIGTSGWSYKSWDKAFYPPEIPKARQFEFYVKQFPTVEINNTFYRLPTPNAVRGWRDKAPPGFVYAVKGSRFITHMKKLTNLDGALEKYLERIRPSQKRIGAVLWQLPPFLKKDGERLEKFLRILPKSYRHAVEFRHPSWLDEEIFSTLRKYRAAHVSLSSKGMPMNLTVTADFIYIRFHGLEGGAAHDYTCAQLKPWADYIRKHSKEGKTVYAYFNNDINVRAPDNAKMLMEMVGPAAVESMAEAA